MDSTDNPVVKLVLALNESGNLKTWAQISSGSNVNKRVTKDILRIGEDKIFIRGEIGWSLKVGVTPQDIEQFISTYHEEIDSFIKQDRRIRINRQIKIGGVSKGLNGIRKMQLKGTLPRSNEVTHGQGQDYNSYNKRQWGDGLTKGKVKLYKGPEGAYWTDPNYKKKEY